MKNNKTTTKDTVKTETKVTETVKNKTIVSPKAKPKAKTKADLLNEIGILHENIDGYAEYIDKLNTKLRKAEADIQWISDLIADMTESRFDGMDTLKLTQALIRKVTVLKHAVSKIRPSK